MEIAQGIDWINISENQEELWKYLSQTPASFIHTIALYFNKEEEDVMLKVKSINLAKNEEYIKRELFPTIAQQKDGYILFHFEILRDTIKVIGNNEKVEKFIISVMIHEFLHAFFGHKSNTEEERDIAEKEVFETMIKYFTIFYFIFNEYFPITESIAKNYRVK